MRLTVHAGTLGPAFWADLEHLVRGLLRSGPGRVEYEVRCELDRLGELDRAVTRVNSNHLEPLRRDVSPVSRLPRVPTMYERLSELHTEHAQRTDTDKADHLPGQRTSSRHEEAHVSRLEASSLLCKTDR